MEPFSTPLTSGLNAGAPVVETITAIDPASEVQELRRQLATARQSLASLRSQLPLTPEQSRFLKLGSAIESVCERLTEGWRIELHLERDAGCVFLYDPQGEEVKFPQGEEAFHGTILDAIEHAQQGRGDGETEAG